MLCQLLDTGEVTKADTLLNETTDAILVLQDNISQEQSAYEEIQR